jgi:hypothetical protein
MAAPCRLINFLFFWRDKSVKSIFLKLPILVLLAGVLPVAVSAQHSDVELGYDNLLSPSRIEIEAPELTIEGISLFTSNFVALDPFNPGDLGADDPGFATNDAEGLLLNANDLLWIQALNASSSSAYGAGYVNYFNPGTGMLEAFGQIAVQDNTGSTADLFLNGGSASGPNPQFIQDADGDGNIHDHVIFDLLNEGSSPAGAYGVLFRLQSDFAPANGSMDVSSDPFWIVFNRGMSAGDFRNFALPAFGAVPEPGAGILLAIGASGLAITRRRRS